MANPFLSIGLSVKKQAQDAFADVTTAVKDLPVAPGVTVKDITKQDVKQAGAATAIGAATLHTALSKSAILDDGLNRPTQVKPEVEEALQARLEQLRVEAGDDDEERKRSIRKLRTEAKELGIKDEDVYWTLAKTESLHFDIATVLKKQSGEEPFSVEELREKGLEIFAPHLEEGMTKDPLVQYAKNAKIAYTPEEFVEQAFEDGLQTSFTIEHLRDKGFSNPDIYRAFDAVWGPKLFKDAQTLGRDFTYEELEEVGLGFLALDLPDDVMEEALSWEEVPDQEPPLLASNPSVKAKGILNSLDPEDAQTYVLAATKLQSTSFQEQLGLINSPVVGQIREELNNQAIKALEDQGFQNVRWDEGSASFQILNAEGEWEDYSPSLWDQLVKSSAGELGGAVAGGILGSAAATQVGRALQASPYGRAAALGTTLVTAASFASAGRAYDFVRAAEELNTTLTAPQLYTVASTAFTEDLALSAAFGAVIKTLGLASPKTWRNVTQAFDNAQADGGYKAMTRALGWSDDQIRDKVLKHESMLNESLLSTAYKLGGSPTTSDKANIVKFLRGEPAMLPYFRASVSESGVAAPGVAAEVTKRADVLDSKLKDITAENFGAFIKEDLDAYTRSVKKFYGDVVADGVAQTQPLGLKYKLDKIFPVQEYLDKVMPSLEKQGAGGDLASQIILLKDLMANNNNFQGLIDMRQAINRIAHNPTYEKSFANTKVFREAIDSIDAAINQTTKYMPEGKKWLENWNKARVEYTAMAERERSALHKLFTQSKDSPEEAIKAFTKSASYNDPSDFMRVLEALTPATRVKAEGAIIRALTDNRTTKLDETMRAIDYPKLAEDLSFMRLATKEGRALQATINDMADLYKSDPTLLEIATNTTLGTTSNNIGVHLQSKVDIAIATQKFKIIQAFIPTEKSREKRMVQLLSRYLDEPLNKNLRDDLIRSAENKDALRTAMEQYATEFRQWGMHKDYGKFSLFHAPGTGTVQAFLDEASAKAAGIAKPVKTEIPLRAMARPVDYKGVDPLSPAGEALLKKNYKGHAVGDEMYIFRQ